MVTLTFTIASLIISASTHLFLISDSIREKRRKNKPTKKIQVLFLSLELEYSEYKEGIHTLSWFFAFLTASLIFATMSNYIFNLALEITFCARKKNG